MKAWSREWFFAALFFLSCNFLFFLRDRSLYMNPYGSVWVFFPFAFFFFLSQIAAYTWIHKALRGFSVPLRFSLFVRVATFYIPWCSVFLFWLRDLMDNFDYSFRINDGLSMVLPISKYKINGECGKTWLTITWSFQTYTFLKKVNFLFKRPGTCDG